MINCDNINVVISNFKEIKLDEFSKEETNNVVGFHMWNKISNFYIKLDDLVSPAKNTWSNDFIFIPDIITAYSSGSKLERTHNIIKKCKELGISCPAANYCVSKGGYLGTSGDLMLFLYKLNNIKMKFTSISINVNDPIWTSTQLDPKYIVTGIGKSKRKNNQCYIIPNYDKLY